MGEPMHSSGLTMREYNEIANSVSKMTDKDILDSVDDINKATIISTLEPVEDIKRWEGESPAIKEDVDAEENKEEKENVEVVDEDVSVVVKKKRPYKRKIVVTE